MNKLNFGCGTRISSGWTNIDFHSSDSRVRRVNILNGFPFPDNYFDAVYSSHVLEHFTPEQGLFVIKEAHRVLVPGGTLRTVVPDLEGTCREYLRILGLCDEEPAKKDMYDWIMVELLDQLVRSTPSGEMGRLISRIHDENNAPLVYYIRTRTKLAPAPPAVQTSRSIIDKLKGLTPEKIMIKITCRYLDLLKKLVSKNLRTMVFTETGIGERHRWMYDRYGLKLLLHKAGFTAARFLRFNESGIPHFNEDCLDLNPDGSSYKNNSLYVESSK